MNTESIKKKLESVTDVFDKITEQKIRMAVDVPLNLIEELAKENEELSKTNQQLKDEINRLKGEQGKPKIRPQKNNSNDDHSSEEERKKRKKKKEKK